MKRVMLLILSLFITATLSGVYAQQTPLPSIFLFEPSDNTITTKTEILFKGVVAGIEKLRINQDIVTFNAAGNFFYRALLSTPNEYHYFDLEGLSKTKEKTSLMRKVFYRVDVSGNKGVAAPIKVLRQKPRINLLSPSFDQRTVKNKILFKGSVSDTDQLFLNDELLAIPDNRFYHVVVLPTPNVTYNYVLKAVSSEGDEALLEPQVFYQGETVSKVLKPTENKTIVSKKVSPKDKLVKPTFFIKKPQNNFVTYKNKVLIEGRVSNAKELFINDRIVAIDDKGHFSEKFILDKIGKYTFVFKAVSELGAQSNKSYKVFRVAPKTPKKDNNADVVKTDPTKKQVFDEDVKKPESFDLPSLTSLSMEKKLNRKITLDLSGVDIKDVMKILAKKGDLNIVADKSLKGQVFVSLQNVTLLHSMDLILNAQGLSYKIIDNTIIVGQPQKLNKATRLETRIVHLNNANAAKTAQLLKNYLTSDESVQAVPRDNLVMLTADSKKMDRLITIMAQVDAQKVPQIILEAQILEISKSSLDNLGVAWSSTYGLGFTGSVRESGGTYTGSIAFNSLISLLASEGNAKVLAKPRIKAIDKEIAEIFIGDQLPYIELTTDPSGRVAESVKYVDSGINLQIEPHINIHTKEIKIKIKPEVSYVNGFKGPNNDIPIVRTRKVSTTVFVKDGQTIIIGGLFNSSDTDNESRMPVMGRVPLLGKLFTSSKKSKDQTELMIAITPKIIDETFKEVLPVQGSDVDKPELVSKE